MPSAPLRFLESWIQAFLGFIVCIVLPILVYAQAVPFADGSIGVAERTIIATALAYFVVAYCGSRLEAFPGASLMDQAAYIAPIVTICFATIGVGLLAWRLEYSRVQFFGSGFLVFAWVLGAAHLRVRLFTRSYAVVPAPSLATMPSVKSCRWLDFDDAVARSVRLDGIVADLSNGLSERELSELARAAISGMPVLDRRYIVESLTGRTPLSGLSPNDFGALLPSRQYVGFRRVVELVCTVAALPLLLPFMLVAYLGGVEIGDGVAINRKVAITTRSVADLASRYTKITDADMASILGASSTIIAPYSATPLAVTVSQVMVDSKGNATVTWSDANSNGSPRPSISPSSAPGLSGSNSPRSRAARASRSVSSN